MAEIAADTAGESSGSDADVALNGMLGNVWAHLQQAIVHTGRQVDAPSYR